MFVISDAESIEETVHGKRLRLAKQYLAKLENEQILAETDAQINADPISHRLEQDVLQEKGRLERRIGKRVCVLENKSSFKGHRLSPTAIAVSEDFVFSAGKGGEVIKWCAKSGRKMAVVKHKSKKQILAIAVTSDGKILASGGHDKLVVLWDTDTMETIKAFTKHRGYITALAFRKNSRLLASGSVDRTINLWNCEDLCYIESLYGHQDAITSMDSFIRERVITVAGHDKTLRLWKIPEESQLVFNGHKLSIMECVSMLNEELFVTGSQDNSVCVWHINKKKPIATQRPVHSPGSWICSIAAMRNTECFWTGSNDGVVKLWACSNEYRSMECLKEVAVVGTVNSISISPEQTQVMFAVGQEHRLGRWWSNKKAKNVLICVSLTYSDSKDELVER